MMPPKGVSPTNLWLSLQQQPRPSRVYDFPRKGPDGNPIGQIAIWPLTQEEHMESTAKAETFARARLAEVKEMGGRDSYGYDSLFQNAMAVEVLLRACRDPNDLAQPSFPSATEIRAVMWVDEVAVLFEHYLSVQADTGPIVANMTKDEVEAWLDRLEEGGQAFPTDLFSPGMLRTLLLSSGARCRTLRTDRSSVGKPPDDSSEEKTTPPGESNDR